jgi:ribosomal protein L18
MIKSVSRNELRKKRHMRVRSKLSGTAECPRLNVFRSNSNIFAQIIDDEKGTTLVSSSSQSLKIKNGGNVEGAKLVGKDIDADYVATVLGKGYDHNWCLNNDGEFAKIAELTGDLSGIKMEVYTDLPGVQIYTANYVEAEEGKSGVIYKKRQGMCFETQYYPDAINHENFQSPVCKAGEVYQTKTVYKFM